MSTDRRSSFLALAGALGLLAGTPLAQGQPAPASILCDSDAKCARLAEQGKSALQTEQYDVALAAYQAAYALRPDPKLLYNLARIMHRAGRLHEAITHYKKYLRDGVTEPQGQRDKANQYLQAAVATIEHEQATRDAPLDPAKPSMQTPVSSSASPPPLVVTSEPDSTTRAAVERRPLSGWRIGLGVSLMGAGLILGGFGGSGLAVHGSCQQMAAAAWQQPTCLQAYNTQTIGGVLLGVGGAAVLAGILTVAIPTKKSVQSFRSTSLAVRPAGRM